MRSVILKNVSSRAESAFAIFGGQIGKKKLWGQKKKKIRGKILIILEKHWGLGLSIPTLVCHYLTGW
jgi:hypothetical protein